MDQEANTGAEPADDQALARSARRARLRAALPWVIAGVVGLGGTGGILATALGRADAARTVDLSLGGEQTFVTLPGFTADLRPEGAKRHYLRLEVVVQIDKAALAALNAKQAPLLAAIQTHLRDQEHRQLVGRAGAEALRQDITRLINREIAPAQARTVLFTQFLLD